MKFREGQEVGSITDLERKCHIVYVIVGAQRWGIKDACLYKCRSMYDDKNYYIDESDLLPAQLSAEKHKKMVDTIEPGIVGVTRYA